MITVVATLPSKRCTCCKDVKGIRSFNKSSKGVYNRDAICSECKETNRKERDRSIKGKLSKIYSKQKTSSKKRNHLPPTYTLQELINWAVKKTNYIELWSKWKDSGYNSNLAPSINRLEDDKGYYFGNIEMVTWEQNILDGQDKYRRGIIKTSSGKVFQYTLEGKYIDEHFSSMEAARDTGLHSSGISAVCQGRMKQSGGFIWSYTILK